jgi:hypothetical protein
MIAVGTRLAVEIANFYNFKKSKQKSGIRKQKAESRKQKAESRFLLVATRSGLVGMTTIVESGVLSSDTSAAAQTTHSGVNVVG